MKFFTIIILFINAVELIKEENKNGKDVVYILHPFPGTTFELSLSKTVWSSKNYDYDILLKHNYKTRYEGWSVNENGKTNFKALWGYCKEFVYSL